MRADVGFQRVDDGVFQRGVRTGGALLPGNPLERTRHLQPELLGLPLPCSVEETIFYHTQNETLSYTGDQLLALARLHSRQVLYAAYPDAVLLTRKEDFSAEGNQFHYRVCYTIAADICQENTKTAED